MTRSAARAVTVAALLASCANPQMPPGGPPDPDAPQLIASTPDSGSVRVTPDEVVFRFDEVISEMASGADLSKAVLVSPSDGTLPAVRWKRDAITVRPRRGWRPNTTYVITLLPVITDLRTNVRKATTVLVFSTGDEIPSTRLRGVAFDWARAAPAARAYIEARPVDDTTLVSSTESDSTGRFLLPFLRPGDYLVRAIVDGNRNRVLDPRETWDSARVRLVDTAAVDFYLAQRDSVEPRVTTVTPVDSLTVRITLDRPLSPDSGYLPDVEVLRPDSTRVPVGSVVAWPALQLAREQAQRAARDSIARADTSTAARQARERATRDSINRAAAIADSIARDTTVRIPPPKSARPALVSEIGVVFREPLAPETRYRFRVNARGLYGPARVTERVLTTPKAAADTGKGPTFPTRRAESTGPMPDPSR
jgi:hypothetical protein